MRLSHYNRKRHDRPTAAQHSLEGLTVVSRFEAKKAEALEEITPRMKTPCLLWPAGFSGSGYGHLCMGVPGDRGFMIGAHVLAHRLARLGGGPIPFGLQVNHACDTRACIAPDHHYLGSHQMNMSDLRRRGSYGRQMVQMARHWR